MSPHKILTELKSYYSNKIDIIEELSLKKFEEEYKEDLNEFQYIEFKKIIGFDLDNNLYTEIKYQGPGYHYANEWYLAKIKISFDEVL